ncbi:cardiomyopathy-associated protein 5-like [Oppia nitens]|uniref:cardiomyopathy-associated protein 5-like n=1 Tax=Oppia nitens TaxID=1686743 RepID=UPI0023DCB0AC|nr:cardiomyopathy-associated protein 5-like [Oppia nitens]
MRLVLLTLVTLGACILAANAEDHLPEFLIARARAIIQRAEADLHRHHEHGRQHLTHEMEREVQRVRELVKELMLMDQSKHVDPVKEHEVELRLIAHENRLLEESQRIEREHHHELHLPEALILRAQLLIKRAEQEIKHHHDKGHDKKLVEAMEHEIKVVQHLVQELERFERHHRMEPAAFLHLEQALLRSEDILLVEMLKLAHLHPDDILRYSVMPEVLLARAREVIHFAESELKRHHDTGRKHLTQAMEQEIHKLRELEQELVKMEHTKKVDPIKALELEQRILGHENVLIAESLRLEREHHHDPQLPEILIKRARAIIARAEIDLKRHHDKGRKHLTQAMEREIEKVRVLEHELMALDQHKHVPREQVLLVEQLLMAHENFLLAESERLEHEK